VTSDDERQRLTPDEANARRVQNRVGLAINDLRTYSNLPAEDVVEVRMHPDDFRDYMTLRAEESLSWMLADTVRFEHDRTIQRNVFVVRTPARRWQSNGASGLCRVDFFEISRYLREELVGR